MRGVWSIFIFIAVACAMFVLATLNFSWGSKGYGWFYIILGVVNLASILSMLYSSKNIAYTDGYMAGLGIVTGSQRKWWPHG